MITVATLLVSAALAAAPSSPEPPGPVKLEPAALQALRDQCRRVATASVAKDWKALVETMYPAVVRMLGGAERAREVTAQGAAASEAAGMKITAVETADPHFCTRVAGGGLQCVLRQTIRVLHHGDPYRISADVIAFSEDRGSHWTFLGAANHDLVTLRGAFPELSPDLPVVPQSAPILDPPDRESGRDGGR